MKTREKLSVEIVRDQQCPELDIEPMIIGVQSLANITGSIGTIIDSKNTVELTEKKSESMMDTDILWHRSIKTDLLLVASDREITSTLDTDKKTLGLSLVMQSEKARLGGRVAVVSTYENYMIDEIAEHETAHLLNLKYTGKNFDMSNNHCVDKECIMYPTLPSETKLVTPQSLSDHVKDLFGKFNPTVINVYTNKRRFCSECTSQLGANAFMLLEAKRGKYVPDSIIFPSKLDTFRS